ncbi:MAG: cysteine desulfurase [Acidobacteria bacterium]|nr:cysteine desulfurase [Acidobacteriota bacterium]MBI3281424.1 cysteine desulfurase [Acidobacteriota bacterium]
MRRFYFDHNATTPVAPEVREMLGSALSEVYGNASSIHHAGQVAKQKLEQARRQTASFLHCGPKEIVFTSGGTESDNLAIFGVIRRSTAPSRHLITSAIEHPAVLASCAQLEREGVEVTYLPVSPAGVVDPDDVRRALRRDTVLISIMHANNETGVVQPIGQIARIAREAGVLFHSDGVQAAGRVRVNVRTLGPDLYSISGHKFYAPKGTGALYVRPGVKIMPLLHGGRHEQDRRAGTENVPGSMALAAAAGWMEAHLDAEGERLSELRDHLEASVLNRVPDVAVNGGAAPRLPNTTSLCFEGVEGEAMVIALDLRGFAVSSGSACSSGAVEPSHVLIAMGLSRERAKASLRISLGRGNNREQVDALADAISQSVAHLRKLSPTYTAHA